MLVIKISNENNRAIIIIIMIDNNKNDNVPCDRLEHQQAV